MYLSDSDRYILAKEGVFYIAYLEKGGSITIKNMSAGLPYYWFNPKTGVFEAEGISSKEGIFRAPDNNPWVLIAGEKASDQIIH